jgi:Flp pilus assembly protein TadG
MNHEELMKSPNEMPKEMKVSRRTNFRRRQRGATLLEFAIGAVVMMGTSFAVLDFGRLLWAHNALSDAARQGARYAVSNSLTSTTTTAIKNTVVYGNEAGGSKPLVNGLTASQVEITYDEIGLGRGTATVKVKGHRFYFLTGFFALSVQMPDYQTTLTGETMGFAPPRI